MKKLLATLAFTLTSTAAFAHGGGLNNHGCHNNHSTGGYHCHKTPSVSGGSTGWQAAGEIVGMLLVAKMIHDFVQTQGAEQQLESSLKIAMATNNTANLYACKRDGVKVMIIRGDNTVTAMSMSDYRQVELWKQVGSKHVGQYGPYVISFDESRNVYALNDSIGGCKFISKINRNLEQIG